MGGRLSGSLRGKFLIYLSAGGVAVAAVGSWAAYRTTSAGLQTRLIQHGYMLAAAVNHSAAIADGKIELGQSVSVLSRSSSDIERIVVVSGNPPMIAASSEDRLTGIGLDQLPDARIRERLVAGLRNGAFGYDLDNASETVLIVAPLLPRLDPRSEGAAVSDTVDATMPSGIEHGSVDTRPSWMARTDYRGAIALVLSRAATRTAIKGIVARFFATIAAAIAAMAMIAYLLLRMQVLRPLGAIGRTIALQAGGADDEHASSPAGNELDAVAGGLERMLADIAEGERRLHDLADSTADWFWETNEQLRFTYCATRSDERLDDTRHAVIGKTPWELVGADPSIDPLWQLHKADLDGHRAFRDFRYSVRNRNGEISRLRVSGKPFHDQSGRFRGFRGTATDETEKFAAQQRAERAESHLLEAIEAISEGFVLFDAQDRLVLCNGKYREFYAGSQEVLVRGSYFEDIIRFCVYKGQYPEAVGREEAFIKERVNAHRGLTGASEQRLVDGRWLLVQDRHTRDGGIAGIRTDITALKQREAELHLAKEAAEVASRAKSEFLSNMSHELRTPLNAIIGFSEVIKDAIYGPPGHPNYAQYAADIYRSGLHLLDVINDILDLSKIEAGRIELAASEIDVLELVRGTVSLLAELAREARLSLVVEPLDELPILLADERALRQILLNLLSNAIKFTQAGGRITARVGMEPSGGLVLAIVDTGIGMALHEVPRALEPFGQIESAHARRHHGTGLGLPLAKKLTEAHGARFVVESELGVGTTISLRFPASRVVRRDSARGATA